MGKCIARVFIFSGRRDPEWEVDEPLIQRIGTLIDSCEDDPVSYKEIPILGYRGCLIEYPDNTTLFAYKSHIRLTKNGVTIYKKDIEMRIERIIVDSAPKNLLLPKLF